MRVVDSPVKNEQEDEEDEQEKQHQYEPGLNDEEEYGDEDKPYNEIDGFLVSLLSMCISTNPDDLLANDPSIIDKLVSIAAVSNNQESHRRISLRCLWLLSIGKMAPMIGFHSNQGWITLTEAVYRWGESGDYESGILYCCMISILLGGVARAVIDPDTIFTLTRWVRGLLSNSSLLMDLEGEIDGEYGTSIVNGRVLQALSKCTAGQSLSGLTLLLLAKQSFRREVSAIHFIREGGLAAVQSLCINGWVPAEVGAGARLVLESALDASPFVRRAIFNSFLVIARSIAIVALPSAQDPLCTCAGLATTHNENNLDGQDAYSDQNDMGHIDEAFEIWREATLPMQRDVDWKPKNGTSWHVSSVVLWAQCPELRATIEGLWEETGGELELGTNTSEYALASAVKFLHTGILFPPPTHASRIDLLKLANELGAKSLVQEAANCILHLMSPADIDSTLEISTSLDLSDFEKDVRCFRATGKRPPINFIPEVAELGAEIMFARQNSALTPMRNPTSNTTRQVHDRAATNTDRYGAASDISEYVIEDENIFTSDAGKRFRGTPNAKIKSGGIYGLLLEAGGHKPQSGSKTQVPQSGAANRIPGKIPTEPKTSRSAFGSTNVQKGKHLETAAPVKPVSSRNGGAERAASAGARPKHGGEKSQKVRESSSTVADSWTEGESGFFEFDSNMSLAPEREPSQREKRLLALSNPKQASPSRKEAGTENDTTEAETKLPKRAQSPTLRDALEKNKDDIPLIPLDPNVRSSLILLKSRSSRRRRSVADVENEQHLEELSSKKLATERPPAAPLDVEMRRSSLRSLVSCTKRQGCTCADCISSLSLSPQFAANTARPACPVSHSFEPAAQDKEYVHEEDEGESEYDMPSFRLGTQNAAIPNFLAQSHSSVDDAATAYGVKDMGGEPQEQCAQCGRLFNSGPYARHIKICAKVFIEKRAVFPMREKRIGDHPELMAERKKPEPVGRGRKAADAAEKTKLWKEQSQQFREAMAGAREYSTAAAAGLPLPPPITQAKPANYIACPHCSRSFSQTAGERHIPHCKDAKSRPKALLR